MKVLWASATTDPTAVRGAVVSGVREAGIAEAQVGGACAMNRAAGDVTRDGWVCVTCDVDAFWLRRFASAGAAENEEERTGICFFRVCPRCDVRAC